MSHYVVNVILPKIDIDEEEDLEFQIEDIVGEILEPFNENTEMESYPKECYCVGNTARAHARKQLMGELEAIRTEFSEYCKKHELTGFFNRAAAQAWEEMIVPYETKAQELEEAHPLYKKPNHRCDTCNGTGIYESTYNPDSKWDWYAIGGRWAGEYKEWAAGKSGDILSVDKLIDGCKKYIEFLDANDWNWLKIQKLSDEEIPQDPFGFALCTPESNWFSKGNMGWFAVVNCQTEERKYYNGMLELLERYKGHLSVVVDLHI